MTNIYQILEGWKLNVEEVSNCVYKIEFVNRSGRVVGCTDHDYERGIETCINYAFDVEKQISKNWNKFVFNLLKYKFEKKKLEEEIYNEEIFGSCIFRQKNKRIILDGKESSIEYQKKTIFRTWITKKQISLKSLEYKDLKNICREFE